MSDPSTLCRGDVPLPFRPCHGELSFRKVYVRPLQRHHFTATQTRLAAQEHNEMRCRAVRLGHLNQPLVVVEIVKTRRRFRTFSNLMTHGTRSITPHPTAVFSITFSTVSTLLTVLGDFACNVLLSRCTSSVVIAPSGLSPSAGIKWFRIVDLYAALPLGFRRLASAWPSTNRGANSLSVVGRSTSSSFIGFGLTGRVIQGEVFYGVVER